MKIIFFFYQFSPNKLNYKKFVFKQLQLILTQLIVMYAISDSLILGFTKVTYLKRYMYNHGLLNTQPYFLHFRDQF